MVPTITHQGVTAESHEAKAQMLQDISFPPPIVYEGDEGTPGPEGRGHLHVSQRIVDRAFSGTSTKKSPGPDTFSPLAIRCLYEWEPERVTALIRVHIRLGVHPPTWKTA